MKPEKLILVRQARFVSIGLILGSLFLAFTSSLWWLLFIPFVVIGALFKDLNGILIPVSTEEQHD
jgi:hypothetical protein